MVNLKLNASTPVQRFLIQRKQIQTFYKLSSESLKIIKFMDVKKQVLFTYRKKLINNLNILVQDS